MHKTANNYYIIHKRYSQIVVKVQDPNADIDKYNWTFDDWDAQFGKLPQIGLFDGMQRGDISCGASVIINMGSRSNYNRSYSDNRFLAVDDEMSIYHYVRLVTGDDSFTKENIERKK